ncbi:MAG: hypothetical protein ACXVBW_12545, partial [Bdellovibrionota bacterium]
MKMQVLSLGSVCGLLLHSSFSWAYPPIADDTSCDRRPSKDAMLVYSADRKVDHFLRISPGIESSSAASIERCLVEFPDSCVQVVAD